jgi:hypothetical protein
MVTVEEIKKRFPIVKTVSQAAKDAGFVQKKGMHEDYWNNKTPYKFLEGKKASEVGTCVGGAFVCYVNGDIPFPTIDELSDQLLANNPNLKWEEAMGFADEIITANDDGDFDGAWNLLDAALKLGGPSWRPLDT